MALQLLSVAAGSYLSGMACCATSSAQPYFAPATDAFLAFAGYSQLHLMCLLTQLFIADSSQPGVLACCDTVAPLLLCILQHTLQAFLLYFALEQPHPQPA